MVHLCRNYSIVQKLSKEIAAVRGLINEPRSRSTGPAESHVHHALSSPAFEIKTGAVVSVIRMRIETRRIARSRKNRYIRKPRLIEGEASLFRKKEESSVYPRATPLDA